MRTAQRPGGVVLVTMLIRNVDPRSGEWVCGWGGFCQGGGWGLLDLCLVGFCVGLLSVFGEALTALCVLQLVVFLSRG